MDSLFARVWAAIYSKIICSFNFYFITRMKMSAPGFNPHARAAGAAPQTPAAGESSRHARRRRRRAAAAQARTDAPQRPQAQEPADSFAPGSFKRRMCLLALGAATLATGYLKQAHAPGDVSTLQPLIQNKPEPTPPCYPICTKNFLEKGQDGKYVSALLNQARHEFIQELGPYIPGMSDARRQDLEVVFHPKAGEVTPPKLGGWVKVYWKKNRAARVVRRFMHSPDVRRIKYLPLLELERQKYVLVPKAILEFCPENPDQCLKGIAKHEMIHERTSFETFDFIYKWSHVLKRHGLSENIDFHNLVTEGLVLAAEKTVRDKGAELHHRAYRHHVLIMTTADGYLASWREFGEEMQRALGAETVFNALFQKRSQDPEKSLEKAVDFVMDCIADARLGKYRVLTSD
jgi:hypothetical protein